MELKVFSKFKDIIGYIETVLENKKNLMLYENHEENFSNSCRFIYSNPNSPLEFIFLDIFEKSDNRIFGLISIITSRKDYTHESLTSMYGEVTYEDILIRGIEKTKISVSFNLTDFDIKDIIRYFEKLL